MFAIIAMCVGDNPPPPNGYSPANKSLLRREGAGTAGGKSFTERTKFSFMYFENGILHRRQLFCIVKMPVKKRKCWFLPACGTREEGLLEPKGLLAE